MKHSFLTSLLLTFCALIVTPTVKAQNCMSPRPAPAPAVESSLRVAPSVDTLSVLSRRGLNEKRWLWGVGRSSVLDTYLTPLTYTGPHFTFLHQSERQARWGGGAVTTHSLYTSHLALVKAPTDNSRELDSELTAAGGWYYNWMLHPRWRLAVGGLIELSGGFTYNTHGGNNPAQGRLGLSLSPSLIGEYRFPLFRRIATARLQADVQCLGLQFSPTFGQSYYEIFSLGHTSGILHFTHPANCPTARLQALVTLPVLGAHLSLGYLADIRQSQLGGLKRHAWRHTLMVGYTRTLRLLR